MKLPNVFVSGQANISRGHQQVNNDATRAGENKKSPNKQSGGDENVVHKDS